MTNKNNLKNELLENQLKDFEKVFKQLYFDKYHKKDLIFKYDTISNKEKTLNRITIFNSEKRITQIIIDKSRIVWNSNFGFQSFMKRTYLIWALHLV